MPPSPLQPPQPPASPRYDVTLNPTEASRSYSSIYGNNPNAFGLSMLGSGRLWRISSGSPAAHAYWLQIDLGAPTTLSGVAMSPGAIWSGTMFVQHYHVRYCTSLSADGATCDVWADALAEDGGTLFDGPQPTSTTITHTHCSSGCVVPSTGTNGVARAFFQTPVVTSLVRIYPYGACTWVCGLRAGLLAYAGTPPSAPPASG